MNLCAVSRATTAILATACDNRRLPKGKIMGLMLQRSGTVEIAGKREQKLLSFRGGLGSVSLATRRAGYAL